MKRPLLFIPELCASASSSLAAIGTFGYGIELTGTGAQATNSGVKTLYALDTGGGTTLTPTGSTGMLSTVWTSASTAVSPTFNLGSFNPAAGDPLVLNGGSILTYQNGGDAVSNTGQYLNFATETTGSNLLSGLNPGTYVLATYGYAGGVYENNNNANFAATFSVVPEPGTNVLLGLGGVVGLSLVLRRRYAREVVGATAVPGEFR